MKAACWELYSAEYLVACLVSYLDLNLAALMVDRKAELTVASMVVDLGAMTVVLKGIQ